jgi:hypothetical protein
VTLTVVSAAGILANRDAAVCLGLRSSQVLPDAGAIEDPAFAAPLPIEALVNADKVDDAMAAALLAKRNPVIEAWLRSARDEGRAEGKLAAGRELLVEVVESRGFELTREQRARIEACEEFDVLERWTTRAETAAVVTEVFG